MKTVTLIGALLVLGSLIGCNMIRGEASRNASVNRDQVHRLDVKVGDEFEIEALEARNSNPKWTVSNLSESYVKLVKKEYRQAEGDDKVVFKFKAIKEGSTAVQLMLKRRPNSTLDVDLINTFLRIKGEEEEAEGAFFSIYSRGEGFDTQLAKVGIFAQRELTNAYGYGLVAANTSNVYMWHDRDGLTDLWMKPFGLYYCRGSFRLQEGGMSQNDKASHLLVNGVLSCRPATPGELEIFNGRFQR